MTRPHVSPRRRTFTDSNAVETAGEALLEIKKRDNLSFRELGKVLGKGPDQAERIAKGNAIMDMPTFLRACREWNGRFAKDVLKLIEMELVRTKGTRDSRTDREKESCILMAALSLSLALEDNDLSDEEIRANRATLENAREAIDALLLRVGPRAQSG